MPENEETPAQSDSEEQRRSVLRLRFDRAETSYANLAVLTTTPEEVVLNFGVNVTPLTAERQVNVEVSNRIIMSYPSAKRLALTLGNVIQRYEASRGVIELGRQPASVSQSQAHEVGHEAGSPSESAIGPSRILLFEGVSLTDDLDITPIRCICGFTQHWRIA